MIINTFELKTALSRVTRASSSRSSLPVLSHVMLDGHSGQLELACTHLEMGIRAHVDYEGDPFRVTVPAAKLLDIVNSVSVPTVELTLSEPTLTLTVKADKSRFSIKGLDADEFPPMTAHDTVTIVPDGYIAALAKVAPFASTDEARPVLMGVLADKCKFVAVDGFRLGLMEIETDATLPTAIIPAKAIAEAVKLFSGHPVSVSAHNGQAYFQGGNYELWAQLIEGNFPDYKVIMPRTAKTTVTMDKARLTSALKRCQIIARDSNNVVTLTIADAGAVALSSVSDETGAVDETIDAQIEGVVGVTISFNVAFLAQAVEQVSSDSVTLKLQSNNQPALIEDGAYKAVVMPMHKG